MLVLASHPILGAIIYDTGPFTADGGAMESDFSSSVSAGPIQFADDFLLQSASQITRLNWWGLYAFHNTPEGPDDFTLRIFADIGGSPSSLPLFQFSLGDLGRVDTGVNSFGSEVYAYSAFLPSLVILGGGTTYWLSIVNNTASDEDDNWYWQRVTRFLGSTQARLNDKSPWSPWGDPSTLAFNIEGTVVPEPSTWTVLALGGVVLIAFRLAGSRRRHDKGT